MAKDQTSFFKDVYEVTKLIPEGRATSYGAIAAYLGTKGSARIVGYAMNGAHNDPGVPAHRVVNRQGLLTGKHHFNPPAAMQERLEAEGVEVVKDQIQNFKSVYWDPNIELAL